jgi:hypothetical protein
MKKVLLYISVGLVLFSSCAKNLSDMNNDPKRPTSTSPSSLYSDAQKKLMDMMTNSNVNRNIFRLMAQYWTETTYPDESQYNLNKRNIPSTIWGIWYRDVLKQVADAEVTVPQQDTLYVPSAQIKNEMAQLEILKAYTYSVIVTVFGPAPYSQALDDSKLKPVFDDDKTIIADLQKKLDAAIAEIDPSAGSFGPSDLFYGGDMTKWRAFAYTLKLRLAMITADVDDAGSGQIAAAVATHVFQSADDNAIFPYQTAPPNNNPIWTDLVQSGRHDFVAANTTVDILKGLNDPRLSLYYTTDADGNYTGGLYGTSNNYATFSKPATKILAPDFEAVLLDYTEAEFLLAEAAQRGYAVPGTAAEHYANAIRSSIIFWGGTDTDATAYLATPAVDYATPAAGGWKEKIGTQEWIAFYNRGYEGWTTWRRFDYPILNAPADPDVNLSYADIPKRFTYPIDEQNLNKANYDAASAAIGGDKTTTRLFWDVQ